MGPTMRALEIPLLAAGALAGAAATALAPIGWVLTGAGVVLVPACVLTRWMRPATRAATSFGAAPGASSTVTSSLAWLVGACPDAVVLTDLGGLECSRNALFSELFGDGPWPDAAASEAEKTPRISDRQAFADSLRDLYRQPDKTANGEITVLGGDHVRVLGWTSEPVRDASGVVVGRGFIVHDGTRARELAALKGDFLSTVTHELRTPLTSIKGSLQLILSKGTGLTAIERELLDISVKNTERLIRLINDILDVSQLEFGKMELAFARVAPGPLVEEAIAGASCLRGRA